ncbi:hypothetical protein [Pedobacter antarcticus]|uniref:PepSY domain-containing protein n=2 Tax=Pedobacter antarcticus TaxID=34086 RepID=A0A081PJ79_9SPHI|nr:hypothetical protein [Pedobacter antarcticus]KEQ30752.1 hypothetical protein N180_10410 [Pedobacter antarcticus 4BY]SDL65849.1 hypothetical protein SAMN04488084_10211 [Pedobacter antarcticus]SFE91785.1 hypothetical protein SAMN03003324_01801 [Pedobacter antarcticus]
MKNLILSAAFIAMAGITTVKANENISTPVIIQQDSTQKVPVKLEELPAPVTTTLQTDAYKEWAPSAAFLVTNADKSQYYHIDVKKGTEVAFIKISKEGVVVQ